MSHAEQLGFFAAVAAANQPVVQGGRLLEIGSYDVNGTLREQFAGVRQHLGVDLVEGPGVDLVAFGHELDQPDGSFDLATSGECFEHDPHWRETFATMVRLTRPGGLVAFTCASDGRPEHGTRRTLVGDSPGTQHEGLDYYRNLVARDFDGLGLERDFAEHRFWRNPSSFDLYFAGVRAGDPGGRPVAALPDDAEVEALRDLMSLPHRALRLPLRAARRMVRDDDRYQSVVLPYWLTLLRVQRRLTRPAPR